MTRHALYVSAIAGAIIAVWILRAVPTSAQSVGEIEQAEALTRRTVALVNELIQRNGSTALRLASQAVHLEVDRTAMPNAHAVRSRGGHPTIVISVQMTLLLFYFAELGILDAKAQGHLSDCIVEYSNYVQRQYAELRTAMMTGGSAQAVRSPERYAAQAGIACSGLIDLYPIPLQDRPLRDVEVANGVAFIYLHELGHHARHHVVENEPDLDRMPEELARRRAFLGYMCRSRAMETDADAFAADALVDLGKPTTVLSTALWSALSATGGIDPALEQINSHPTGGAREAFVFDRVRARLEAKGQPFGAIVNAVIDDLLKLMDKVQRLLPTLPLPDGSSYVCP